jgi:hypothetical protein
MAQQGALDVLEPGDLVPELPAGPVSRAELLLSGSSGQDIVDAVWRWSAARWAAVGVRLWACETQGLRLLAGSGQQPGEAARVLARKSWIEHRPMTEGESFCQPIEGLGSAAAILQLDFHALPGAELGEQMLQVAGLLAQRLPAEGEGG